MVKVIVSGGRRGDLVYHHKGRATGLANAIREPAPVEWANGKASEMKVEIGNVNWDYGKEVNENTQAVGGRLGKYGADMICLREGKSYL